MSEDTGPKAATLLVVDDEAFVRDSVVEILELDGHRVLSADSATAARTLLAKERVDLVLSDLDMPGPGGLTLLAEIKGREPDLPVVILTGVGTVADAVAAMKSGAYDFLQKPVEPDRLVLLVRRALDHARLQRRVVSLAHAVDALQGDGDIVGESPPILRVKELVKQVAPTDATVLLTGESGTGKEVVARAIHRRSDRAELPLVRVNCASIPETLFESEFFGHRRGAFTGAVSDRTGRFAEAEGGTLVLDEIGTLQPAMQAKLLRVLESREYQVVGESRTRTTDARIIASTNEDLQQRVQAGEFRADLFYRLNLFPIALPPLRDCAEDVGRLAEHFLRSGRARPPGAASLDPEATEVLRSYDWPGNVRELRNVLERALILTGGETPDATLLRSLLESDLPATAGSPAGDLNLRQNADALERRLIAEALRRTEGRKGQAAELLGIDPRNLGYYLRKHGMQSATGEKGAR